MKFAESEKKLEQQVELVQKIYKKARQNGSQVPLDDRTQLDDVVEWVEKFNVSTEKARIYVKDQESKYEVKLNESIAARAAVQ